MIGIVPVTHGNLAREFIAALEHVMGPQPCVVAVCISASDDMEKRRAEILEMACRKILGPEPKKQDIVHDVRSLIVEGLAAGSVHIDAENPNTPPSPATHNGQTK
jgi:hypothetical protein